MEQPSLDFSVRRAARATDLVTSVMAAEQIAPHVHAGQMKALEAFYLLSHTTLDDFELADWTGLKQTSIGKRRGELERMGLVEKAERRESRSKLTTSIVQSYRITEAGLTFYARETNR
jgi:hypothetical protein